MRLNKESPTWCKIKSELEEITDSMPGNDLDAFIQWRGDVGDYDIYGGGASMAKAVELQKMLWEIESLKRESNELSELKHALKTIKEAL